MYWVGKDYKGAGEWKAANRNAQFTDGLSLALWLNSRAGSNIAVLKERNTKGVINKKHFYYFYPNYVLLNAV